jgi:hypothetical protein
MKPAGTFKNLVNVKPIVLMSYELRGQIMAFVNGTNASECQWFLTIDRDVNHKGDKVIYTLRNMLIPEQEVTGATVESPEKGMLAIWNELKVRFAKEEGGYDRDAVNGIISKMHAWCHSHVNMTASPSGTDESTFRTWIKQNEEQGLTNPVIMMIVNKREEVYIRIYDPEQGIYVENPDIEISMPAVDTTYVDEAIKNKVKNKVYNYQGNAGFQGNWNGGSRVWQGGTSTGNSGVTGTSVSDQSAVTDPKAQPSNHIRALPTIVRAGRSMLGAETGKLEQELIEVATLPRCQEQAENATRAVMKALDDTSELYIFTLLLKNEPEKILQVVSAPKSVEIPAQDILAGEILALVGETWYEHPHAFYATVCTAARIANVSGKAQKRIKEAENLIGELNVCCALYESPLSATTQERSL